MNVLISSNDLSVVERRRRDLDSSYILSVSSDSTKIEKTVTLKKQSL